MAKKERPMSKAEDEKEDRMLLDKEMHKFAKKKTFKGGK